MAEMYRCKLSSCVIIPFLTTQLALNLTPPAKLFILRLYETTGDVLAPLRDLTKTLRGEKSNITVWSLSIVPNTELYYRLDFHQTETKGMIYSW
jgi:hypothetical protein